MTAATDNENNTETNTSKTNGNVHTVSTACGTSLTTVYVLCHISITGKIFDDHDYYYYDDYYYYEDDACDE